MQEYKLLEIFGYHNWAFQCLIETEEYIYKPAEGYNGPEYDEKHRRCRKCIHCALNTKKKCDKVACMPSERSDGNSVWFDRI